MRAVTVSYEMTDALVSRAVRENCLAFGRTHFRWTHLVVAVCSAVIFLVAVRRGSHWLWWAAGFPPAVIALWFLGWLGACGWLPGVSTRRLAGLPYRKVVVELDESGLAFTTAAERLQVQWGELRALTRLETFWLICLRAGSKIPVPASALPDEAVALMRAKLESDSGQ